MWCEPFGGTSQRTSFDHEGERVFGWIGGVLMNFAVEESGDEQELEVVKDVVDADFAENMSGTSNDEADDDDEEEGGHGDGDGEAGRGMCMRSEGKG